MRAYREGMANQMTDRDQDLATMRQLMLLDTETLWSIQERGPAKWSAVALLIIRSRSL